MPSLELSFETRFAWWAKLAFVPVGLLVRAGLLPRAAIAVFAGWASFVRLTPAGRWVRTRNLGRKSR